jgi:hypothetical protein
MIRILDAIASPSATSRRSGIQGWARTRWNARGHYLDQESGVARGSQRPQARGPRIGDRRGTVCRRPPGWIRSDPRSGGVPAWRGARGIRITPACCSWAPSVEEGGRVCKFRSVRPGPEMKRIYFWVAGPAKRSPAQSLRVSAYYDLLLYRNRK